MAVAYSSPVGGSFLSELGTIIRALGCCPTEQDVHDVILEVCVCVFLCGDSRILRGSCDSQRIPCCSAKKTTVLVSSNTNASNP